LFYIFKSAALDDGQPEISKSPTEISRFLGSGHHENVEFLSIGLLKILF
jgi:hypothetical protein